jgi:hypothetical protein
MSRNESDCNLILTKVPDVALAVRNSNANSTRPAMKRPRLGRGLLNPLFTVQRSLSWSRPRRRCRARFRTRSSAKNLSFWFSNDRLVSSLTDSGGFRPKSEIIRSTSFSATGAFFCVSIKQV